VRKLLVFFIIYFAALSTPAQNYGNEWINYSQKYFKVPIPREAIYRIDSVTLAKYYTLTTLDPNNLQVFIKGKEQFIYIRGESDGKINTGDYIEFYANPLMGDIDSLVYTDIKYVPNPYLPITIYADTLYAFITLNNSVSNKRYTLETDTNWSAYPPADHFYSEKIFTLYGNYNIVDEFSGNSSDPHLTQAEGRGFNISKGSSYTFPVSSLNTYTNTALDFYININFSGMSQSALVSPDHQLQTYYLDQNSNPVLLADTSFYGFTPVRQTFTINAQNTGNSTSIRLSSVANSALSAITNSTNWHYAYFFYPHTLDLAFQPLFKLFIDNSASSTKQYFDFSNFNTGTNHSVILLDITNGKRITTSVSGNQIKTIIPDGPGKKLCILSADANTELVSSLYYVNQSGYFRNYLNNSPGKTYVIIYHGNLTSSALQYRNYRKSITGGGYNTIDADIDELYEQFAYGAKKHPASIRNFIRYLKDKQPSPPSYIFLIGKAAKYESFLTGSNYQSVNYLPTIGYPASDNLFTCGLSSSVTNQFYPEIPIGRLAVTSNSDVSGYLSKVQEHESSAQADWKKRVLHFVGGDDEALLNNLTSYMNVYEQIIKDTLFGGDVYTFKKNTTAPIQINISDSIKNTINNGAALLNFFGHGSEQGFDQAIDDPELYNNKGRYPFIIANSCYSGDIHVPTRTSVSERFVLAKDKGSIGFLATGAYGFDYALNNYTREFYKALSGSQYNKGVGDIVKETVFQNSTYDALSKIVALDMTLNGDPAIKISNGLLPDYQVFSNDLSFNLKKNADSVAVTIHYKNLGKAIKDSFFVRIERFFPNGDSTIILKQLPCPLFKDSIYFNLAIDFKRGIGLNKFKVYLDYFNEIGESNKSNNITPFVDLFIPGGDVLPVYPYYYAIVPKTSSVTLKASTTDPFAPITTYRFELDTCDKFINPIAGKKITSSGGVLEWNVSLPFKDSTVYFWRVSKDSTGPTTFFNWKESSFQTIGAKQGWGQSHFNQFKNDGYQFVSYKKTDRKFVFENNKISISCRDAIAPVIEGIYINYFYNTVLMSAWGCGPQGWNFAIFDSIGGEIQQAKSVNFPTPGPGPYNECVCVPRLLNFHSFGANNYCGLSTWKTDMENFLNSVPVNNYVLAFTVGDQTPGYAQITTYSNSLYTAFESIGASKIRTIKDTVPYILFGRKGMSAGQGHELAGAHKKSIIYLEDSIKTRWHSGFVASEIIGPSYKWNSLHWRVQSLDPSAGDTTIIKLVGIQKNGQEDTLGVFTQDSLDIGALYNYVNANSYPYLKLVAFMRDNIYRTSPQLKRWQVLYDQAPECAINPLKGFASINDTLYEGDEVSFRFPIENIGDKDFTDSLVVTYWMEDNNRIVSPLPSKMKPAPFKPGQVIIDTIKINTYQLRGNNSLWIYVNPIQHPKYQKEQSQFNNIGRYTFKVNTDVTNPLMDVTFDGIRILNGDIVSAKPNILITLKDENKFLALNDTGAFTVLLQPPGQTTQQRLYFAKDLQFTPADLPKNSCSITYNPIFATDGKYTLIAQARDRSKNASGTQDYRIEFEIDNKPSVTNVLNYPNPFTTSTRFVFTLTGSEIPEVFTIRIMTVTGKLVREITRAELGNLHIGRNITEYAWDGRDNFGDRLAIGVYLYHVITKLNGENIEKNGSGADKFFVKDFGKMVLMR
jgi:hypothetical protein